MSDFFKKRSLLELMKPQNLLSLNRQSAWALGTDASFSAGGLVINATGTTNGVAATLVAPILPGSVWKLTASSVFTTGSATVTLGGTVITLAGGADEVHTVRVPKGTGDTIDPMVLINQVVATGNVDVSFSAITLQLMDDFTKEQDIQGYFGCNDSGNGINN